MAAMWGEELWVDQEAQERLEATMERLDSLMHGDHEAVERGKETNVLLIKQNMDTRAAKESTDEWQDWKMKFPHFRVVGSKIPIAHVDYTIPDQDDAGSVEETLAIHPHDFEISQPHQQNKDDAKQMKPNVAGAEVESSAGHTFRQALVDRLVEAVLARMSVDDQNSEPGLPLSDKEFDSLSCIPSSLDLLPADHPLR
jgi:hypothetical protein